MKFPKQISKLFRFFWRWTRKLACPGLFALVCLVTLAALYIAEENYRTGKEWENYKAAAEARGVKFTIAELVPPPVPDDQNFAMTPLLKPLFTDSKYGAKLYDRLNFDAVINASETVSKNPLPDGPTWATGKSAQEYWAEYFRKVDVTPILNKDEADLAEISAALLRPYARFPFPTDNQAGASRAYVMSTISRYTSMLNFAKIFHMRASFELANGKYPEALADALTQIRLSQSLNEFPFSLAMLTQYSILGGGLDIVWDGMQARVWTDAQLLELQQEIQKIDFLRQLLLVEQGERASFSNSIEWFASQELTSREKYVRAKPFGVVGALPWRVWLTLHTPRFVFTRALLTASAYYDQYALPAIDSAAQRIHPDLLNVGMEKFGTSYLSGSHIIANNGAIVEIAHAQTTLNEAATACALERYRIAHGEYPEQLDELVPQYIAKLPYDVMTGGLLQYQLNSDGSWELSATGWSSSYDNNNSAHPPGIITSSDKWVWQHPAK